MNENTTGGYDSGVDCCERQVSEGLQDISTHNNQHKTGKTTIDNGNLKFCENLVSSYVEPEINDASNIVLPEKTRKISPNEKHGKPIRRKKRKHLFTARRRKNRTRNIPQSYETTSECVNAWKQDDITKCFSEFEGMNFEKNGQLPNSQSLTKSFQMGKQHEIVNVTDHVSDDILHMTGEYEHIVIDSDQDSMLHVENDRNGMSESNHVCNEINHVNNKNSLKSNDVIFESSQMNSMIDGMFEQNKNIVTEMKHIIDTTNKDTIINCC